MAAELCGAHGSIKVIVLAALLQDARGATAAAAAAAVVREATASAVMDVLEGESEEEKAAKVAAAKEARMRKVIRSVATSVPVQSLKDDKCIPCLQHSRAAPLFQYSCHASVRSTSVLRCAFVLNVH